MPDFILKSGAMLTVSMAPFEIGIAIKKAHRRIGRADGDFLSDDEMEKLFFQAAQSAIYRGAKLDRRLFDDHKLGEQARGDYDEIFEKVLEVNLAPFFPKASSSLSTSSPTEA